MRVPAVHTIARDKADQVLDTVSESDVIVHQPIGENFGPVSSDALKSEFPDKTFLSFPSIYFGGVLPHLSYLRQAGGAKTLQGPLGDYHDLRIVSAFVNGHSEAECLAGIDDLQIDAKAHYDTCMAESLRREEEVDIPLMKYVDERIADDQIFYTFNHVDNHLLWVVAQAVVGRLGLTQDGMQAPPQRKLMGGLIASVPQSLVSALGFGWESPSYILEGEPLDMKELIARSYAVYSSAENFNDVLAFNKKRFALSLF